MSAVSSPAGGRDSGEFSTLIASAGRLGTTPPGGVWPVRGHLAGGGGGGGEGGGDGAEERLGEAEGLAGGAAFCRPHPAVPNAPARGSHLKRTPRLPTRPL